MSNEIQTFLSTALECSRFASSMCRNFKPGEAARTEKVDKTWVTEADTKIEKELRKLILEKHPTHHILGEEEGGNWDEKNEYTWILDPIDGTFSFVHGVPFYSSLIALMKGSKPIVGVASLPALEIEMYAAAGHGAYINGALYKKPALVGQKHVEIIATADHYRFRMEQKTEILKKLYDEPLKSRTYCDALGYYLLLQGSVRAFVDPKVEVWDVAPFHVILPEAGFAIQTWEGAQKLQRGTSVAYSINTQNKPENCDDVLRILSTAT